MARLARKLAVQELTGSQVKAMPSYCGTRGDILALYLYGSYATPYQTALSDIDLALLSMPEFKWSLAEELEIEAALADIVRSDDLNFINLRRVPVHLRFRVLESGRLLYCRDRTLLADFIEQVICHYLDFAPDLATIYGDYDAGLREEFRRYLRPE